MEFIQPVIMMGDHVGIGRRPSVALTLVLYLVPVRGRHTAVKQHPLKKQQKPDQVCEAAMMKVMLQTDVKNGFAQ